MREWMGGCCLASTDVEICLEVAVCLPDKKTINNALNKLVCRVYSVRMIYRLLLDVIKSGEWMR